MSSCAMFPFFRPANIRYLPAICLPRTKLNYCQSQGMKCPALGALTSKIWRLTMNLADVKQHLRQLGALVHDMESILDDGTEDAPLAFFEACEDVQHQITQLMRASFIAV